MLQGEEQPKGTGESGFFEELGEALSSYGWSVRWEGPGEGLVVKGAVESWAGAGSCRALHGTEQN